LSGMQHQNPKKFSEQLKKIAENADSKLNFAKLNKKRTKRCCLIDFFQFDLLDR
jgi:hypothetical protein